MFRLELHENIVWFISVFYRVGLWQRGDEATAGEWKLKFFVSFYYFLVLVSFITGTFASENTDEFIFLLESSLMLTVSLVKLIYLIWEEHELLELLNQICVFRINDQDAFIKFNEKLKLLMRFIIFYLVLAYVGGFSAALIAPLCEKKLLFNIGFPLDYKNSEISFYLAFAFTFTGMNISAISCLFTVIIWYLTSHCGLRYEVLGEQIKSMGKIKSLEETAKQRKMSDVERDSVYLRGLLEAIKSHTDLMGYECCILNFLSINFS